MVGLGDLPGGGFSSGANGVSADGSVVVGQGSSASGFEAFIWDATNGMRSLKTVLIDLGLGPALAGWTLTSAWAISPDGLSIVGYGTNPSGDNEAWIAQLGGRDQFPCYITRKTRGTPRFEKTEVSLEDQFENKDFVVKNPRFLCTPADKNDGGIGDPDTHLRGYRIRRVRGEPRHDRQRFIQVVNQFGTIRVDTKKPDRLLVPTLKDLASPVDLPSPFTPPIDHFKCYKVRKTKKRPKFKKFTVTVQDQFINTTLLVKKPKRLCVPVDKDGGGIIDQATHLMCYRVKKVKKKVEGIHVNNQFGPEQLDTKKVEELCVSSKKILLQE